MQLRNKKCKKHKKKKNNWTQSLDAAIALVYILLFALFLALIGRGKKSLDTRTINNVELFIKDGLYLLFIIINVY